MKNWENAGLESLNHGHFRITDPGPLHAPIRSFSIRRDDSFKLILETEAALDAKSNAVQYPTGTVRLNSDTVELVSVGGSRALLTGVQTLTVTGFDNGPDLSLLKETASVHEFTLTQQDQGASAYVIDWLENMPCKLFLWPDSVRTVTETSTTQGIALSSDGVTISETSRRESVGSAAAKLEVSGVTLYVCALKRDDSDGLSGCIVYEGVPDELTRKKIRVALSFALGTYLVDTGHSFYDKDWCLVSTTSRAAYSLFGRAFNLIPMPIAPLSNRGFEYDLGRAELTRMVQALVSAYDKLDLGNLSWAYWHACAATIHIAPAHFGAAIEALQRTYIKNNSGLIATRMLDGPLWESIRKVMIGAIRGVKIEKDYEDQLKSNINGVNRTSQRMLLKAVMQSMGLELGVHEDAAWRRRNKAAHGLPIPEGEEVAAIRDMKLLQGIFLRMLLKITNAADLYIDYVSAGHPLRPLREPAP